MKRTLDADREEWDIIDDGSDPFETRAATPKVLAKGAYDSDYSSSSEVLPIRKSSAIKPSAVERKRKRSSTASVLSPLVASLPGSKGIIFVRLAGKSLTDLSSEPPEKKGRGRPKGSKNKPKPLVAEPDAGNNETPQKKDRGRPTGSKKKPEARVVKSDVEIGSTPEQRRRGRPKSSSKSKSSRPLAKTEKSATTGRGRAKATMGKQRTSPSTSLKRIEHLPVSSADRPRRKAAPAFLGESPKRKRTARKAERGQSQTSLDQSTPEHNQVDAPHRVRPRRASAPEYLGESPATRQIEDSRPRYKTPRGTPSQDELTSVPIGHPKRKTYREFLKELRVQESPVSARKKRQQKVKAEEQDVSQSLARPKRKAAPQFLGEGVTRKRRKVNSVGSRRSVLQN